MRDEEGGVESSPVGSAGAEQSSGGRNERAARPQSKLQCPSVVEKLEIIARRSFSINAS